MKITIEHYDNVYTAEFSDGSDSAEIIYEFTKLLVNCGFPPSVIRTSEGGRYECEYKEGGEC